MQAYSQTDSWIVGPWKSYEYNLAFYGKLYMWLLQWKGIAARGVLELFFDGVCGPRSEPLPISKDFSPSKNGWFKAFFRNFRKSGPISKGFSTSKWLILQFFRDFCEMGPSSKDFFGAKWDPCLRIFAEKVTHLGGTSPYALTCEYPPPGIAGYEIPGLNREHVQCTLYIFPGLKELQKRFGKKKKGVVKATHTYTPQTLSAPRGALTAQGSHSDMQVFICVAPWTMFFFFFKYTPKHILLLMHKSPQTRILWPDFASNLTPKQVWVCRIWVNFDKTTPFFLKYGIFDPYKTRSLLYAFYCKEDPFNTFFFNSHMCLPKYFWVAPGLNWSLFNFPCHFQVHFDTLMNDPFQHLSSIHWIVLSIFWCVEISIRQHHSWSRSRI